MPQAIVGQHGRAMILILVFIISVAFFIYIFFVNQQQSPGDVTDILLEQMQQHANDKVVTSDANAIQTAHILEQAQQHYLSGAYPQAESLLTPLAASGDAQAQYHLGLLYLQNNWSEYSPATAIAYLQDAIAQGYHQAMWQMGQLYDEGKGVARDPLQAQDWYRKAQKSAPDVKLLQFYQPGKQGLEPISAARMIEKLTQQARNGDIDAQYGLAKNYELGKLVRADMHKALYWYRQAAEQGDEYSMFTLGYFYCRGIGLEQDKVQANIWLSRSQRDAVCK